MCRTWNMLMQWLLAQRSGFTFFSTPAAWGPRNVWPKARRSGTNNTNGMKTWWKRTDGGQWTKMGIGLLQMAPPSGLLKGPPRSGKLMKQLDGVPSLAHTKHHLHLPTRLMLNLQLGEMAMKRHGMETTILLGKAMRIPAKTTTLLGRAVPSEMHSRLGPKMGGQWSGRPIHPKTGPRTTTKLNSGQPQKMLQCDRHGNGQK
mmetsp:Transcript_25599/g.38914  ORF Transcript_25599/g.38914 Transcript_25599/m.38914 type:complete len:202 (+) Transcript_25599:129-734(+)